MATTAQKTTMTTPPITTPGNLPTLWHVPKPLSGMKSRQKPVFKVESGSELSIPGHTPADLGGKNNTKDAVTNVPVATPLSLTLASRILAVGDAGRAVAKLLLEGAGKSGTTPGSSTTSTISTTSPRAETGGAVSNLFLHHEMEVLHLGPHLILPKSPDEEELLKSGSPMMTEGQRARFLVSKALEKSRAQVVLLEKQMMRKSQVDDAAENKAVLEIWERTFKQILLSEGLQTFKGAVVCCIGAKEEERLTSGLLRQFDRMAERSEKKSMSWNFEKWFAEDWMDWDFEAMDVVGGQELRQDPILRPKIELLTNAYETMIEPESPYYPLYDPVQKLFGTCFQDDFADFAQFSLAKPEKGWLLWLLIERKMKQRPRFGGPKENQTSSVISGRPRLHSSSEVSCPPQKEEALELQEQQPTTEKKEEEELVLLGFLIAKLHPKPRADLRIERVGVVENVRGQGYGDRLMEGALEYAKNIPQDLCKWVSLEAFDYVVPYYERLGFTDMSCLLGDSEEDEEKEEDGKVRLTLMEMKNISRIPAEEELFEEEDSEDEEEPEDSEEDSGFLLPPPMKSDSESTCSTKEELFDPEDSDEEED